MFQQVLHKVGQSEINCIKIFQNAKALEFSVVISYTEVQMMHIILEIFNKGGKYSAQIEIHQAEFRREEKFIDQK